MPEVALKKKRDSDNKINGQVNGIKFSARLETSEVQPNTRKPKILSADVRAYLDNEARETSRPDTPDSAAGEDDFEKQFQ